ncbi:hypothetical protein [Sinorhizobium terangae]|uniref:hypothetical protein n=1 Tax=Sinorhizobium terangae TaxID=110322 RepID=UPI0024B0D60D|nr:hypothetical protein [Sinorhizobium terangae]WFU51117.1 hypothetical protein QA637_21205 [Sinorhizobium terangae]
MENKDPRQASHARTRRPSTTTVEILTTEMQGIIPVTIAMFAVIVILGVVMDLAR